MRGILQNTGAVILYAWCFAGPGAPEALASGAGEYRAGTILVTQPWAPPTLGKQRIGVVYFTVRNQGQEADRLLAIDLPDGGQAQIHFSQAQDGVMRMRPADPPLIPPGGELNLRPGGMHAMLTDLPGPLIKDEKLRLTLRFELAGPLNMEAAIEKRPAASSAPSPHQGH